MHYDLAEMNRFLQRYGRYPQLYAKSLADSICIFILSSESLPHTYQCYHRLLESMQADISGVKPDEQAIYATVELEEYIINIQDEETMRRFVQELGEQQNWFSSLRHCISEIRSGRWFPTRCKLISLGLHLNMDLDEMNQMWKWKWR